MDKKDLQHFRDLLIKERKKILEELDWVENNYIGKSRRDSSGDVSSYSMHPADMGTDSIEMEKAYMIGATGGDALANIDEALINIDKGDYGLCIECGEPIPRERLEAVPHAKLCITCKSNSEGSQGAAH